MKRILETERLYLRELQDIDVEGMFKLDSNPAVHQYLGKSPISTMEEAQEVIKYIRQQYIDHAVGRLAVIEKESEAFLGWAGFKLIQELTNGHQDYYDLGYRFIQDAWGKGYATEISKALVDYGFNEMKLSEMFAITDAQNLGSQNVLQKCGFVKKELFDYEREPHYWLELQAP